MPIVQCTCSCVCNNKFRIPESDSGILPFDEEVIEQMIKQICSNCVQNIHYNHDESNYNSLEILKKRLARGEISIEEYDEIRSRI